MLSRLFAFEQQKPKYMPVGLTPSCRNVPDKHELCTTPPNTQHNLSMCNMRDLQPIVSNCELFADGLYINVTDVFITIDTAKLQ